MMAGYFAAQSGSQVTILERYEKLGRKLYITGKGRCNLTNHCSAAQVLEHIPRNPKFLYSAMEQFPPQSAMQLFSQLGLQLKTERGNRVFPASDKAADVIDTLHRALRSTGRVQLVRERAVALLLDETGAVGVKLAGGEKLAADRVVLATGGCSYPATGSTGDGYTIAKAVGHTIVPPTGSLVALVEEGTDCAAMQGLSLKNIEIKVYGNKKRPIYQDFGELLFTHFGLSGPVILSASAHMRNFDRERYTIAIDLKPALEEQQLDARLLREFSANSNRHFSTVLGTLLPRLMIPVVAQRADIPLDAWVHSITREQRHRLLSVLKRFEVPVSAPRPVEEAIVTSGGVKTSEINPSTLESKLCPGLYFAGELMDVDAYTGGFNLQIAWATGRLAGIHAATDTM